MYTVTKIMTDDGSCFDSEKEARRYLDKKYGNLLTKMAHRILQQEKYVALCEFLDANLDLFSELIDLKNELSKKIKYEEDDECKW